MEEESLTLEEENMLSYIHFHFSSAFELDIDDSAIFMNRFGVRKLLSTNPNEAILALRNKFVN